jgi:hypothetical protein
MQAEVDSALFTQPRSGGEPFRIAEVTAFFLRDLQPPAQVVQAINNKLPEQQFRRAAPVGWRLGDQQPINRTHRGSAQALSGGLHDMGVERPVVLVPTEGGMPLLDLAKLRGNLQN